MSASLKSKATGRSKEDRGTKGSGVQAVAIWINVDWFARQNFGTEEDLSLRVRLHEI
jgi:hypothetical protein